jgi:hypothetical protein
MLYTIDSETQEQSLNSTFEIFRAFTECPRKPLLELAQTKSAETAEIAVKVPAYSSPGIPMRVA